MSGQDAVSQRNAGGPTGRVTLLALVGGGGSVNLADLGAGRFFGVLPTPAGQGSPPLHEHERPEAGGGPTGAGPPTTLQSTGLICAIIPSKSIRACFDPPCQRTAPLRSRPQRRLRGDQVHILNTPAAETIAVRRSEPVVVLRQAKLSFILRPKLDESEYPSWMA